MGFGLCAFGYAFLMLEHLGLDVAGYVLISVGFFGVASELKAYKGYKIAAFAAAACVPFALLNLYLTVYDYASLPALPQPVIVIKGVALALLATVLSFAHGNSTSKIAADGGAKTFSIRALATAYLTALYSALKIAGSFAPADGTLAAVIVFGQYVVIFLNMWLLFTCFTTITTKRRQVIEEEIIERETEKIVRKKLLKKKGRNEDEA